MKKTAIILLNLGGPDNQEAVQPFLFNLFSDKAIIRLPQPLRYCVAKLISSRRAPIAKEIYAQMGGGSPILKNTQEQAQALEKKLNVGTGINYKCFIAMRYWRPFADAVAKEVVAYAPDEILLLPLYPQFSTTTTQSSFDDWAAVARKHGIKAPTRNICCYPQQEGFIGAVVQALRPAYDEAQKHGKPRILFSAHGLPEKIIAAGDPYQAQCQMTVDALRQGLAIHDLDSILCFQSRVGPLKWITPATDEEVRKAGQNKVPLIIVPIAFVSDHSETLVEINIEYRHLAKESGVPHFTFIPAVGAAETFIDGLAQIIVENKNHQTACASSCGKRLCASEFSGCPCA